MKFYAFIFHDPEKQHIRYERMWNETAEAYANGTKSHFIIARHFSSSEWIGSNCIYAINILIHDFIHDRKLIAISKLHTQKKTHQNVLHCWCAIRFANDIFTFHFLFHCEILSMESQKLTLNRHYKYSLISIDTTKFTLPSISVSRQAIGLTIYIGLLFRLL